MNLIIKSDTAINFHKKLLNWFAVHGRHDLPWKPDQKRNLDQNLYYIWLSEIMLQQTQVVTVIPYFSRFIEQFPDIKTLANAPLDEVLKSWEGLGYYSRAQNLHHTAKIIHEQYHGAIPCHLETLIKLKGIGRTTAAAILAQGMNRPFAILDGNVKRVLARIFGVFEPSNRLEKALLPLATTLILQKNPSDYTQAIMDFGATLCKKRPLCTTCFFKAQCFAWQTDQIAILPTPKPKKILPRVEHYLLIVINNDNEFLVEKRPAKGIWPNLYSFPERDSLDELNNWINKKGIKQARTQSLADIIHRFTHYELTLKPIIFWVNRSGNFLFPELTTTQFVSKKTLKEFAKPKPITSLCNQHFNDESAMKR